MFLALPGWRLLVTEFRVHAARDPELSRRYPAAQSLRQAGLAGPRVTISHAEAIARDPGTGKVRRFVPSDPPRSHAVPGRMASS